MENIYLFFFCISLVTAICLGVSYRREKQCSINFLKQLDSFKGQTDDEIYGRGKFSELGMMTAGITHEISNPLSVIVGKVSQMLKRDSYSLNPEDLKNGLELIQSNAERITTIINSVREYIYSNKDKNEDFISLKEIIDDVLVFYGQRLKNHGIKLHLNNINKVYLSGHKGQLEQAFLNLLSNSFDAVDNLPEKWIEISAVLTNENIQVYVKDSGHGIPKEVSSKMLDPFFSTKKEKGTGLGLSLIRGIAQKHGGSFKYIEAPNTTFLLELPQASSANYQH